MLYAPLLSSPELAHAAEMAAAARLENWLLQHCRQEQTHVVKRTVQEIYHSGRSNHT
jgi:hypothetical protein